MVPEGGGRELGVRSPSTSVRAEVPALRDALTVGSSPYCIGQNPQDSRTAEQILMETVDFLQ